MRCGFSVGRTTAEASMRDQLNRFKTKTVTDDRPKIGKREAQDNPAKESLKSKCISVIVDNFATRPLKEVIPPEQMAEITCRLPTNMPPTIGARYIYNENYWKRCCVEKYGWQNCRLPEHGFMWKQMYFEKFLQERLEDFDTASESVEVLYDLLDACMDYIFTLSFQQLPSHLDLYELCSYLPNLTRLNLTYGVNNVGMNYERMLFGMKISDATNLAKTFESTQMLSTLILTGNMIDDDLLRMLMTGLIRNNTVTFLDMSHNRISNHGARLLSKLLDKNSVLNSLVLVDNQIHTEGGRYFARALRDNKSLSQLNLRLNHLGDDGCRLLLEGVQDNLTLVDINLASNNMGNQGLHTLCSILREKDHKVTSVDLAGNDLTAEHIQFIKMSLAANRSLTAIDLRRN
ncbi:unnamed protein product, partial [Ectocarpus fasciculatus]